MNTPANIGIVDDEPGMLKALTRLLRTKGFSVHTFLSARDFLTNLQTTHLDCVVLDVSMPDLSGLEVQDCLKRIGVHLPIIFLSGQGSIPMSVRAIKAGATSFLTKPVDDEELIATLEIALAEGSRQRAEETKLRTLQSRMELLTPREHEVWQHVISGKLNKQIAADLQVSEQTVKVHRMRLTEKLGAPSVPELVRAAQQLGVRPAVAL